MAARDTVPALKAVIVGDNNVGKTSLLIKWYTGQFPEGYIPSVFEQEVKYVTVEGETLRLEVWETGMHAITREHNPHAQHHI